MLLQYKACSACYLKVRTKVAHSQIPEDLHGKSKIVQQLW